MFPKGTYELRINDLIARLSNQIDGGIEITECDCIHCKTLRQLREADLPDQEAIKASLLELNANKTEVNEQYEYYFGLWLLDQAGDEVIWPISIILRYKSNVGWVERKILLADKLNTLLVLSSIAWESIPNNFLVHLDAVRLLLTQPEGISGSPLINFLADVIKGMNYSYQDYIRDLEREVQRRRNPRDAYRLN